MSVRAHTYTTAYTLIYKGENKADACMVSVSFSLMLDAAFE